MIKIPFGSLLSIHCHFPHTGLSYFDISCFVHEDNRAYEEGLTEEELEIYDLLIMGKHLTKAEEQKVKLAAKHLFNTLMMKKAELMVVEWYKDEQTKALVRDTISAELDKDLPDSYDKESFNSKTNLLLNHFMDMSVQGYGWIG